MTPTSVTSPAATPIRVAPIAKLLVANRAEIAMRVIRTARAMGIATVAVHSDADATAPHVTAADEAVRLPGTSPADTYLDAEAVLDAARRTGADALHPGYGFLSENAAFARACADAGLVFVGPDPATIDAMGSKVAAKALMAEAGVPVLPGATIGHDDDAGDVAAAGERVGFPLLVKASFGGGGRGMRIVRRSDELVDAVASAQREAASAFGDGTVFLERLVDRPRHVEVQVFGDRHGTVVHLFERECSIQRRYQKIVEEAPSPAVDDGLRAQLGAAAVDAARALRYVGAGTVEFVLDPDGAFWFLEVNTRLQVEHPVTEMITGLDLVELQLLVAEGRPLPGPACTASIRGHAIEARLYAEDVPAGYVPTGGPVDLLAFPDGPGLRVDAGYTSGGVVPSAYDAMIAKVIAWGPDRDQARRRLAAGLRRTRVHGPTTNRDLLVGVLTDEDFAAGATDTGFLDRKPELARPPEHARAAARRLHAVAATLAGQAARRAGSRVLTTLPSGWRNVGADPSWAEWSDDEGTVRVDYSISRGELAVAVDGVPVAVTRWRAEPDHVVLEVDGVTHHVDVACSGSVAHVDSGLGATRHVEPDRFPDPGSLVAAGSLQAPMPGAVVQVSVAVGDPVAAGDVLVMIEAMKMEHAIRAAADGVVAAVEVAVGEQVETGAVLVVLVEDGDG